MKQIRLEIGINYQLIRRGCEPPVYEFCADVVENVSGSYGVRSHGDCKSRYVDFMVPDWVEYVRYRDEGVAHIGRKDCYSKSGTANFCFVICKKPVKNRVYNCFGEGNTDALIDEAMQGGFELVYPAENGDMLRMDVQLAV